MNIDELAYELRNLSVTDTERLFDRLNHNESRRLFETGMYDDFYDLQTAKAEVESEIEYANEAVDEMRERLASLKDHLSEAVSQTIAEVIDA